MIKGEVGGQNILVLKFILAISAHVECESCVHFLHFQVACQTHVMAHFMYRYIKIFHRNWLVVINIEVNFSINTIHVFI